MCRRASASSTPTLMIQPLLMMTTPSKPSKPTLRRMQTCWPHTSTNGTWSWVSVTSVFHLANRCAARELNVNLNGSRLKFDPSPKYLGVTLDRSLTFHQHAKATAVKTRARVSLLRKLAGTGWGADFTTLRTCAVALAYSTAEYASPAWSHSKHVDKVDVVLNDAMRLVSGALTTTPVTNLQVLSGIPPANLRRRAQSAKLAHKRYEDDDLIPPPVALEDQRLPRRHFATESAELDMLVPT